MTGTGAGSALDVSARAAAELSAVRRRSLGLLDPLPEEVLVTQHSPLMSPLVWDMAHVANYEDIWLLRALGQPGVGPSYDDVYDAFRHRREERPRLELMPPAGARAYLSTVRGRVLDELEHSYLGADAPDPLLAGGFVYGMVAQHEHQHDETMLATLQIAGRADAVGSAAPPPPGGPVGPSEVLVEAGPFLMGTSTDPWAYDNERPAHHVETGTFWIDTAPVTNTDFGAFVDDGGYTDARHWSGEGWAWREESGATHPGNWVRDGSGWLCRRFGTLEAFAGNAPVQHVCWYEAEAYARWRGKRLPTEAEWEKAAAWEPTGRARRHPWGERPPGPAEANLGSRHSGPAPIGAYPAGTSPWGCHQMLGDVWEWTASSFAPYPGFEAFPYREYSEVFFSGQYKVLRGGSWATDALAARCTFRNWDLPVRRQIFSGFRCARDP